MTEIYEEMENRHREELDRLPIQWAFGKEQLEEALKVLGVEPGKASDIKLVRIPGGGICTEETSNELTATLRRQVEEQQALINADTTGQGFIFDMFDYQLANHEFCITGDFVPAIEACGLSPEDVEKSPELRHGLKMAINVQYKNR